MRGFSSYLSCGSVGPSDDPVVYGRDIAVRHSLAMFWRYGESRTHDFFVSTPKGGGDSRSRQVLLETLAPSTHKRARIAEIGDLKANFDRFQIPIWHDFDADILPALSMRSRFSRSLYPVTATVHVLSYQEVLGGWVLPMLLGDVQPCDALISTSQACQRALKNIIEHVRERIREQKGLDLPFHGQLPVIPHSVNVDEFQPRDKRSARRALNLPEEAFIVGWVGRVSAIDKADLVPLLQVFARLLRANPRRQLVLLIGGGGTDDARDRLRRCSQELGIGDEVRWIPRVPPEERARVFAALDVFTSPADNVQETAGITPLEAMASGVPQVVSDWNGYRESVEHGVTGFRVPTLWTACDESICLSAGLYDDYDLMDHFALAQSVVVDQKAFQEAFQALVDNPDLCQRMGKASRRRALTCFHPQAMVNMYESLWKELKLLAQSTRWKGRGRNCYDVPAWHRDFHHYASVYSAGDMPLTLTEEGRAVAEGRGALGIFGSTPPGLSSGNLSKALAAFTDAADFGAGSSRIAAELGVSLDAAQRHLLWLMKYQLITSSGK